MLRAVLQLWPAGIPAACVPRGDPLPPLSEMVGVTEAELLEIWDGPNWERIVTETLRFVTFSKPEVNAVNWGRMFCTAAFTLESADNGTWKVMRGFGRGACP